MPKFDVVLVHTVTRNLTIEISAKDDDAAEEKAQKLIEKLEYDPAKIANEADAFWEEDENDFTIDSVQEQ